jgi:hypothetical protein
MLPLPGLSPVGGKKVAADFDCGLLSSDGRNFGSVRLAAVVEAKCRWSLPLTACGSS